MREVPLYKTVLALTLFSIPAIAITDGWELSDEFNARQWRTASAQWAADIHPDEPTALWVASNVTPPPREMWCSTAESWELDCDAWDFAMEQWLHHYLDIPYSDNLPTGLAIFPQECSSSCGTW